MGSTFCKAFKWTESRNTENSIARDEKIKEEKQEEIKQNNDYRGNSGEFQNKE